MSILYVYVFLVIAIIGFIKGYSDNQYDAGYDAHKAEVADAKDESDSEDQKDVKTVIKWRTKEKVVYRDKVKKIYLKPDSTGCRDTKLVDMGISLH